MEEFENVKMVVRPIRFLGVFILQTLNLKPYRSGYLNVQTRETLQSLEFVAKTWDTNNSRKFIVNP